MKVTLIGIDLAKSIFQVCGVNQATKPVFNRRVRRNQPIECLSQYPDATIAMEACSGSNYWGRELQQRGFTVMLIPPQHVKPFVKGNKNDRNDTFAICEAARRLTCIKGVGNKIASATTAFIGNGQGYRNGRHFVVNLGLVPKEHSSGGKQRLGHITKRGNAYIRHLLIQGAWSVVRYADRGNDRLSRWTRQIIERRGKHKAAIAVANKLGRIIWAMSYHQTEYRVN